MEQIYDSMMTMLQRSTMQQEIVPTDTVEKKEGTSFRNLLAKKNETADTMQAETPDNAAGTLPEETMAPAEDPMDLEEQLLAAAALSAMQMPIVSVQQVEDTQAKVASVIPFAEQPATLVPGATAYAEGAEQQMRPVMEETQIAESIQPIQNNQAAEGKTTDFTMAENGMDDAAELLHDTDEVLEENTEGTPVFRGVKDILVKVGETTEAGRGEAIEVPVKDQVGEQISKALENGEMRLSIRLNPENLGQVDVELTLAQDGALRVELRADNQITQRLLEKESTGLQQMLVRNMQQDVQIQVARHQESQQQAFEDGRQGGHHQNPHQERREERQNSNDFLQQLRLGLIPLEAEAS